MGRGGGFPTDRLITKEQLIEEFLCPICMQVLKQMYKPLRASEE